MGDYRIEPVTDKHSDEVIRFLKKFFFRDEPLNVCVNLIDKPGGTCEELEKYCLDVIPEGFSWMALSNTGSLIGVCLNGVLRKQDTLVDNSEIDSCKNKKFRKILNLIKVVGKESNVFAHYPDITCCLDIMIVSVDDSYRGQGIAKELFNRTRLTAKEKNIPLVRIDCSSHYSNLAVAKLGYRCIYTLNYSDHLDGDGNPVFVPEPPHTCVKTYVLEVN